MKIEKEKVYVLNKIDLFEENFKKFFEDFKFEPCVVTNAKVGFGVDSLKSILENKVNKILGKRLYYFNMDFDEFDRRSKWIKK